MANDDTVSTVADPNAPTLGAETGPANSGPADSLSRYRLGPVLGQGGMGEVLSAEDPQIGRSVAIKRMRSGTPSPEATARFVREAKIQARLDHPAIVPVHELARDSAGAPFFVMKQLAGVTLADVLSRLAAGDPATTRDFTRQRMLRAFAEICLAVEFAHQRGIVHRDLKPANIALGEFGEVYVLDWGIAKVAGEARDGFADVDTIDEAHTIAGAILGTPGYMSPEQVEGSEIDGRADVYALGCMLFEILALAPLHARGREGLASALAGKDARPSRIAADTPPELDAACVRATASLADRIATARELGDHVQRFLDGDRDLAARTQLAREALTSAREALAADAHDADHRAIRAAARAIALDPRLGEAAELMGALIVKPPHETPPEVERDLASADLAAGFATRKLMSLSGFAYLFFLPIGWWAGFRDPAYLVPMVLLAVTMIVVGKIVTLRTFGIYTWAAVALHMAMIALVAQVSSPFLLGPALAVTTAMALATQRRLGVALLTVLFSIPVVGVWALEELGALPKTTTIESNHYVLTPHADLDPIGATASLVVYSICAIAVGAWMMHAMTNERRAALRHSELQAWKLKQLVR